MVNRTSKAGAEATAGGHCRAFAVAMDGSRLAIEAHTIVIDLGAAELEVNLHTQHVLLAGRLGVRTDADHLLIVGPGDANSVVLGVEPLNPGSNRL